MAGRQTNIRGGTLARTVMPMPGPIRASGRSFPMIWLEFRISGTSVVNSAVVLGVMPLGRFLNAMEIVFREENAAASGRAALRGYCSYRVRQTVEEHNFQHVNGRWNPWSDKAAGTPDDPDPQGPKVQSWDPPYLRMFDTPGWSGYLGVGPNTRRFVSNGVLSDVDATEVWVQQVFQTWAQGEDCFTSAWQDASRKVTWHSSLHLVRANPTSAWGAGGGCRIAHGPMAFGPATQL